LSSNDPSLEVLLRLELGIAGRIEGFDIRDLFGGNESLSDGNDFHGDLLCMGMR